MQYKGLCQEIAFLRVFLLLITKGPMYGEGSELKAEMKAFKTDDRWLWNAQAQVGFKTIICTHETLNQWGQICQGRNMDKMSNTGILIWNITCLYTCLSFNNRTL